VVGQPSCPSPRESMGTGKLCVESSARCLREGPCLAVCASH